MWLPVLHRSFTRSDFTNPQPWLRIVVIFLLLGPFAFGQHQQLPYLQGDRESPFTQLDFAQMYLEQQANAAIEHNASVFNPKPDRSGFVSALDLAAPDKAVQEYQHGVSYLRNQSPKDAIRELKKAIGLYSSFVSAHNALGVAYLDLHQDEFAKAEFRSASQLDDHFALSFVNLGMMSLWANDFASAESNLEKAAGLNANDPTVLSGLAFAQNGNHDYAAALRTAARVHNMEHAKQAVIHYVAASAAQSLHDLATMRQELSTFLSEDPSNPLAPVARKFLDQVTALANGAPPRATPQSLQLISRGSIAEVRTFPNNSHLRSELDTLQSSSDESCDSCTASIEPVAPLPNRSAPQAASTYTTWGNVFTIHQTVDETAVFFAVSSRGHTVNDLSLSNIQIRDDDKAPERILQFTPQSRLPLRLGLLIDTSGSIEHRISFEKRAAQKFMEKVLNPNSDLAFVAGFNNNIYTTQDFTSDQASLAKGIENLPNIGDGTSVFDAIYYGCWKLAAYPDTGRVAKVLVILTDGEDNASTKNLQQSIDQAEASGVTVYTINTSDNIALPTDANKILQMLAQRTGGESIAPGNLHALDQYLSQLPDVIRSRYLIAYRPADFSPNGKYRTIRVVATKNGKHLKVHARKGYYARLGSAPAPQFASQSGGGSR